ncbi:MAG TPA: glycoside hydrolase domain-containing protein [Nocardioidaceae bacterium]|nr:glycoside hydrolase domain-containing protein [Nocardioidaceae bacterium]
MTPHHCLRRSLARVAVAGLAALSLALPTTGADAAAGAGPAPVARATTNPVTPGNFTGYGFDQCLAPTQKAMDAWLESSPFWAVGIYISGNSRHCRDQPNLTPTWISTQLANGWRLLPITLGPQAYCNPRYPKYGPKIDPVIKRDPTNGYAAAKAQGVAEATKAVGVATKLGIAPKSTLWYDLEAFDIKNKGCRLSAISFLDGWTEQLHELGFVSGAYSSGGSGIIAIDNARVNRATFDEPDMIWVADWSGAPFEFTGTWLRDGAWLPGRRVHQYRGGHDETHGGVRINIDSNFLDTGLGSVPKPAKPICNGTVIDFARYTPLDLGTKQVARTKAAQCLLKRIKLYTGPISGAYDARTGAATSAYRTRLGLPAGTAFDRVVWTARLAAGRTPLMKYGAYGPGVRRLQRALNAAVGAQLPITGTFASATTAAVKKYQDRFDLPMTGVVTEQLWALLQHRVVE